MLLRRALMLRTLKRTCLATSRRVGLSRLIGASSWRRQRVLIIGWHGVSRYDEDSWNPELYLSAETFRRRLGILRRTGSTVLGLSEAVERLARGTLPPRAVVLTFDDGYVDFKTIVWPALKAEGWPATVYLTTLRCEHNQPIVPLLLSYIFWRHQNDALDGRGVPGLEPRVYALSTATQRLRVQQSIEDAMRASLIEAHEKDEVVRRLVTSLGSDYEALVARRRMLTLMNPGEVQQVAAEGADVQLHTHRHFPPRDTATFRTEISENATRIEAITSQRPSHFCYPSGLYRQWHEALLQESGVASATTCEPGLAHTGSNPFLLPRFVDTNQVTDTHFESWVTGAAALLPRFCADSAREPREPRDTRAPPHATQA